jgi:hypothetical protein
MISGHHTYFGTFKIFNELNALRDLPLAIGKIGALSSANQSNTSTHIQCFGLAHTAQLNLLRPHDVEKGRDHACVGIAQRSARSL